MNPRVRARLVELNRAFYQDFAEDFARTRRSLPPGFARILPYLGPAANVFDLGCGNGRLLGFLAREGWRGTYTGLDASRSLLVEAEATAHAHPGIIAHFKLADFTEPDWPDHLQGRKAETVLALAVLHHLPGRTARAQFVADCAGLLSPDGILILTTWLFLSSDRLRARILPWESAGLTQADVEPEDYLLSWGKGGAGSRYCAYIEERELIDHAAAAGLSAVETFYSDGHEGNLNLYGVFKTLQEVAPNATRNGAPRSAG